MEGGPLISQATSYLLGNREVPSIIARPPTREHLQKHIGQLLEPVDQQQMFKALQRLRERAEDRSDLPISASFAAYVFGVKRPRPQPGDEPLQLRDPTLGKHGKPKRPSGRHKPRSGKHVEKDVVLKEDKANTSRSGRSVKTPSKFKEPDKRPMGLQYLSNGARPQLSPNRKRSASAAERPTPKSARGGARGARPRGGAADEYGDEELDDEEYEPYVDVESRLGEDYQADVPAGPLPGTSLERGDTLLWSPEGVGKAGVGAALRAYLEQALPLVGGPPQQPPSQVIAFDCV